MKAVKMPRSINQSTMVTCRVLTTCLHGNFGVTSRWRSSAVQPQRSFVQYLHFRTVHAGIILALFPVTKDFKIPGLKVWECPREDRHRYSSRSRRLIKSSPVRRVALRHSPLTSLRRNFYYATWSGCVCAPAEWRDEYKIRARARAGREGESYVNADETTELPPPYSRFPRRVADDTSTMARPPTYPPPPPPSVPQRL